MKITKKITKLFAKDEITVASLVGVNLKAQKLALDHTNIKCIQNHDESCRSILFSPCLNHTLNLAVKDMIHTIPIFENSHDIATLFLKFFKEKEIQRMHKFSFALCEQRWLYLYDSCLYLLTNNNIISKIVSDEKYHAVLTRNSYERLAEGVPYYVYFAALLLQPLKILSKRLESNDCALYEYPILYNSIYKFYDQLSKQYALYDEFEEIRNCIEWRIRNTARYELIQISFYLTPLGRIEIMNKRNTEHRYKDFYSPVSPITPIHIINPGIKIPDEYVLDDNEPNEVINPEHILNQDINELVGPKMFDPNRIVEDDEEYHSVLDQEIFFKVLLPN